MGTCIEANSFYLLHLKRLNVDQMDKFRLDCIKLDVTILSNDNIYMLVTCGKSSIKKLSSYIYKYEKVY